MSKEETELSPYAKFHYMFAGKTFVSTKTNQRYAKGEMWDKFRKLCIKMSEVEHAITPFVLIDSIGWSNGKLIDK